MSDQDATTPRVFLFRHGETLWAKSGRFTGSTEISLTEAGIAQVSSARAKLVGASKLVDPQRLVRIFVSPRERAKATFELLFPSSSDPVTEKVTFTEDITEWNYGDYEGLTHKEIRDLRQSRGLDLEKKWDIWTDGCEGGETMQQVTERVDRLISEIKEIQRHSMHGEKPADVLLRLKDESLQIAHGLILRVFWKRWLGFSVDHPLRMMFDPGEVAVLSYKNNDVNEPAFHLGVALPPC